MKDMHEILKNNFPHYLLIEFGSDEKEQTADDEDVLSVSRHLIDKNRKAYGMLAN